MLTPATSIYSALLGEVIPDLRPPESPIAPTFLEQHQEAVGFGGAVLLAAVVFLIWWWRRPRLVSRVPPVAVARQNLSMLAKLPEDGALAGQVSRVLRIYLAAAVPALARAELTPEEMAIQLPGVALWLEPAVKVDVIALLRECNRLKFSSVPVVEPLKLVARAQALVEQIEAARAAELRKQEANASGEGRS